MFVPFSSLSSLGIGICASVLGGVCGLVTPGDDRSGVRAGVALLAPGDDRSGDRTGVSLPVAPMMLAATAPGKCLATSGLAQRLLIYEGWGMTPPGQWAGASPVGWRFLQGRRGRGGAAPPASG